MNKVSQEKESTSGTVTIEDDKIIWKHKGQVISMVELTEVAVIGEYTTANGPWLDDWFLVFVKRDGSFTHIPFYVDGRESLINFIQSQLKPIPAIGALASSTHWASVVDYPDDLKSQPLFRLQPTDKYNPPKTWFAKMLSGLGLGSYNTDQEILLSKQVDEYIKTACL